MLPAIWRSATLAMLTSSTSMNVAIETMKAMTQGLIADPARPLAPPAPALPVLIAP